MRCALEPIASPSTDDSMALKVRKELVDEPFRLDRTRDDIFSVAIERDAKPFLLFIYSASLDAIITPTWACSMRTRLDLIVDIDESIEDTCKILIYKY